MSTQTLSRPAGRPYAERVVTTSALTAVGLAAAGAVTGLVIALTHDASATEPVPTPTVVAVGHQPAAAPQPPAEAVPAAQPATATPTHAQLRLIEAARLPHPAI